MTVVGILELAGLFVVLAVVAPVVWLFARRRWLSAKGGVFDCGLHLRRGVPGGGWALGLARYEGNQLEWYRALAFTFRPRVVINRSQTVMVDRREPDQVEALVLFSDHEVVRLREQLTAGSREHELALAPASMTGLMSWLEAAPPGAGRYPGVE